MLQIPTFGIGDKVRQLEGEYELICPNCDYDGGYLDEDEPPKIFIISLICTKGDDLYCARCESIIQRGAEGWYVVEETPEVSVVLPYNLIEKIEK